MSQILKESAMTNSFVIKGNICQTKNSDKLDLYERAFAVCAGGHSDSIFRAITDAIQVSKMYFRMVDEAYKPLVFSEALYLATKGGGAFFGKVGSFEEGYEFDAVVMDDSVLPHPQKLNLAERMERAVYLGLDEKNITAKFVAGRKIM